MSFRALIADWLGDGLKPAEQEQAQKRANVCIDCPLNDALHPWEEYFKGKAIGIIKRQIELKNSMKLAVNGQENLHICGACGCILKLKVWVPLAHIIETMSREEMIALHQACWIRSEHRDAIQ